MCKGLTDEHRAGEMDPDWQPIIDYVNTGANYAYTVRDEAVPGEGWVGNPPFESYADVHPVTGEAREMTDPPFVLYHLDTCDIGHCAPGCPCTHVKIGKEERSPWARPIEKEKVMDEVPANPNDVLHEEGPSVAWSEVSRALEVLSIDTTRAIRVEMDQQYVFVTEFARNLSSGQILSGGRNSLLTKTTRYEIDLTR